MSLNDDAGIQAKNYAAGKQETMRRMAEIASVSIGGFMTSQIGTNNAMYTLASIFVEITDPDEHEKCLALFCENVQWMRADENKSGAH